MAAPVVLVTGCSSGFGLLTAVSFARCGARVFASMRDLGVAGALLETADAAGVELDVVALDVTQVRSVEAATRDVLDRAGQIDVVVNNAGVQHFGAVHLTSDDEAFGQLDTNVLGVLRMVRAVVPAMIARGSGTIINLGSVAGRVGQPYSGLYSASKHAVEALTESMHFELSHHGIRVALIQPGQFGTELGANAHVVDAMVAGGADHERWQAFRVAQRTLVGSEPPDPQMVADAIVEAATTDHPKLRWPVGADAAMIIAAKDSMSFEDFESLMRETLDWQD